MLNNLRDTAEITKPGNHIVTVLKKGRKLRALRNSFKVTDSGLGLIPKGDMPAFAGQFAS